jgi:tRNA dimethylallyltransferase
MQIYKKMDIGTAKIRPEEMEGVCHYLVDELDPSEEFHVARFQEMAKEALEKIYAKGKIPMIVGGTGFYIQGLLYDIDFAKEDGDKDYRNELSRKALEEGNETLHQMLREVDWKAAQKIHPNNVKRVIRALEFYKVNGYPISEHNEEEAKKESPYRFAYFVLNHKREVLYDRINQRVDRMAEQGLFEEVKKLKEEGYKKEMVSMQGIGYKEVFDYLEGRMSREETMERIKKDTRHFAKRQLTWFGREKEVTMIDKSQFETEEDLLKYMLEILRQKGIYHG